MACFGTSGDAVGIEDKFVSVFAHPTHAAGRITNHQSVRFHILCYHRTCSDKRVLPYLMSAYNSGVCPYAATFVQDGLLVFAFTAYETARIYHVGKYHGRTKEHIVFAYDPGINRNIVLDFDALADNHIRGYDHLSMLAAFQQGRFQVQDVSSMLAACVADPHPGDTVLDLCAAPGGKSLHMADRMLGCGYVQAQDLTPYKVELIQENIERSGLNNVMAVQQDATVLDESWEEKADVVLADVPCSGYGVIGRKADIKYHASKAKENELIHLQRTILENAASYVKEGGTLVFSTCTVNKRENEENFRWFLEEFPFEPVSLNDCLPEELHSEETEQGYLQLIPGVHNCDGFFLSKFRKKEDKEG